MSGELYQLVAIDEKNNEYVIELDNDNKNNKGFLSFIDSKTTGKQNEEAFILDLIEEGKLNNKNVKLVIKYTYSTIKYLPIIYNNPGLCYLSTNANDKKVLKSYAEYFINKIENDLCNSDFYNYILELNDEIFSQISNGNYLDDKVLDELRRFYEAYGISRDDLYYKEEYKHNLATKLNTYKRIRTIYIYYQMYLNSKLNKGNNYDIPDILKYLLPKENVQFNPDIPQELQKAYDTYGMDGVWAIADAEDIVDKGYKFR